MAKYIIDIPDDTTCLSALRYEDGRCVSARSCIIPDLTPYVRSESYIDGLKKGQNDAWELARRIICPSDCCEDSISAHTKEIFNKEGWEIRGIFNDLSYQEAKTRYDSWKKKHDEESQIHVGDEVQYSLAGYEYTFIVFGKENDTLYGIRSDCEDGLDNLDDIYDGWETCYKSDNTLRKTGRHFDEVEKLLERMREE